MPRRSGRRFPRGKAEPTFLEQYFTVVDNGSAALVMEWIQANAGSMTEDMFFEDGVVWDVEDYQILTLRAFAPEGVFTEEARESFLRQIKISPKRAQLEILADALFGDDDDLINMLPDNLRIMLGDHLSACMKKAYKAGIRSA